MFPGRPGNTARRPSRLIALLAGLVGAGVLLGSAPGGVTDPERVALHVPETGTSRVRLPAGYEFLGPAGAEAWVTTEAQDSSVVWPGWSFEGIDRGVLKGTVKISYTGFGYAGPSAEPRFAVTQPGGFDRTKVSKVFAPGTTFTSTTGEVGGHTHTTWSFTAKGTYDIGFKVSATLLDSTVVRVARLAEDGSVLEESEPLELKVAGGAAAAAELASDKDSYRAGETATFTLSGVDGATGVEWSARSNGENDFRPIEGASGTTLSRALDRGWDGSQVRAVVRDAGGAVLAEADVPLVRVREPEPAPEAAAESGGVPTGYLVGGAVLLVVVIAGIGLAVRGRRTPEA